MTAGNWERAVREQVALGRLLPLGTAADGTWIAERAAAGALRRAAAEVREARVTSLRVGLATDTEDGGQDPGRRVGAGAGMAVGPAPMSALPYGELRISAECEAAVDRPMTATAEVLREALLRGAEERLGLRVAAVDIHVTGLLDTPRAATGPRPAEPGTSTRANSRPLPGLLALDTHRDGDHAEVHVVVDSAHRALDVTRAVRARTSAATVTVLVTGIR